MKCERCGAETEGTYSEGGIKWAICEDCMTAIEHDGMLEMLGDDADYFEAAGIDDIGCK